MKADVILLPGLHGSSALFGSFVALAPSWARCRPLALPTLGDQTFDGLAGVLEAELRSLEGFVLFGESFSGPVVARIAGKLGSKVALTILCNPLVEAPVRFPAGFAARCAASPRMPVWCVAHALTGGDRPLARAVLRELRGLPRAVLRSRLAAGTSATREDLVPFLSAPLLTILGMDDRLLSPGRSRGTFEGIPFSRVAELSGPHLLAQTRPADVWKVISEEFETAA